VPRDLLYIMSPSYSGSTLLTYLLAQHPDVSTVGELKATQMGPKEDYHCSCGAPILDCVFWQKLQDAADGSGLEFSIDNFGTVFEGGSAFADKVITATVRGRAFELVRSLVLHLIPGVTRRLSAISAHNRSLADIVCELQGGRIFLDGSKDPSRLMHLANSGDWNVYVICLQRDGRGVSTSIRSHAGVSYPEAVRWWQHAASEIERMRGRLDPSRVLDLRYEDLCENTADCMRRVWEWLGVEPVEIRATQFKSGDHHILGNAMRLSDVSEIRLDEKWRAILDSDDLRAFEQKAGHLNRRLGYGETGVAA